ncbi:MAG: pilus assembly protein [Geminicoccaceae bacterium]|nr:pilus assembly protein [Geminicoccaceae bacterium]
MKFMNCFGSCRAGIAAMEFALTAPLFFLLVMGIFDTGFYFMQKWALITGLDRAQRVIQTGEILKTPAWRRELSFRDLICRSRLLPNCEKRIVTQVRELDGASMESMTSDGKVNASEGHFVAGNPGKIMGVEVVYRLPPSFVGPILEQSKGPDGSVYINAMTIFRTEPY